MPPTELARLMHVQVNYAAEQFRGGVLHLCGRFAQVATPSGHLLDVPQSCCTPAAFVPRAALRTGDHVTFPALSDLVYQVVEVTGESVILEGMSGGQLFRRFTMSSNLSVLQRVNRPDLLRDLGLTTDTLKKATLSDRRSP